MKSRLIILANLIIFLGFTAVTACTQTASSTSQPHAEGGELVLENLGNVDIGPGIIGKIDDRDYLFLAKSVEGSTGSGIKGKPGILVFDLQSLESPTEIAYLEAPDQNMYTQALTLSGTVLYASTYTSLWIIDVSTPSAPKEMSRLSSVKPVSTAVSGRYAYISGRYAYTEDLELNRVVIADISNPALPEVVGNFGLSSDRLEVSGSLLFDVEVGMKGLHIFDISSPGSLERLGYFPDTIGDTFRRTESGRSIPVPSAFFDIAIANHYVYLASGIGGLRILDISNPATPHEISDFKLPQLDTAWRVFISGHLAYLITGGDRDMINIIDIADPSNPTKVSSRGLPTSYYYSGNYAEAGGYIYCFAYKDHPGHPGRVPVIVIINLAQLANS